MARIGTLRWWVLVAAALSGGGCVTQYRKALQDREAEILNLKEENTSLRAALDETKARERLLQGGTANPTLVPAAMRTGEDAELQSTRSRLDGTGVETDRRNGRIVLTLPEEITFASGKAALSGSGRSALKTVSDLLKKEYAGRTIWIEGHTDNEPIRKSGFKSNRHLSLERAFAVMEFLRDEEKISENRFVLAGHGEFSPVADNSNAEGRKKNRRVELVIGD